MSNPQLLSLLKLIGEKGFSFEYTSQPGGDSLLCSIEKSDCILELWETGKISCQFGVDMHELRTLVSGHGNEDIGEDELQRVAREHLRPRFRKYGPGLRNQGFEETVEVTGDHYAVSYEKPVGLDDPNRVISELQTCFSLLS